MANQVHFVRSGSTVKVLFDSYLKVAMSDICCCDSNGSMPGYAIYARDCCTGEVQTDIFLDLTNPPTNAFTKRYHVPGGFCIRFDPADMADAILMSDPGFTGTVDFLATGYGTWDQYGTCSACRCDHSQDPCCYDYVDYPDLADILRAAGQRSWSFSGITALADISACHQSGYFETDGITPTYQQVTKMIMPTGPYTSEYNVTWTDQTCDPVLRPDNEVIVTYYHDNGCTTLSDNRGPATDYMTVIPEAIILPAILHYSADPYSNLNIFDSTAGFVTPSADVWTPCDGTVTFPDSGYAGTRPGGGGSATLYACCPDEPGGV